MELQLYNHEGIKNICRACLCKEKDMKFLSDNTEDVIELLRKFNSVANVEMLINNRYPAYICKICETQICKSYDFQQQCKKSNEYIHNYLDKMLIENIAQNLPDNTVDSSNESSSETFLVCQPTDIPTKNKEQQPRLKQYAVEDVDKVISVLKKKFYRHVVCVLCNFVAINNRSLSVHMTRIHREIKIKWCSSCNQLFENVELHNRQEHLNDLKCSFCNKINTNMGHFIEHLLSHSAQKLFKCNICLKAFISARYLRKHKEMHSQDNHFECKICGSYFSKLKVLKKHLQKHNRLGENNNEEGSESGNQEVLSTPQNFCSICQKKVRSLTIHISNHHSEQDLEIQKKNLCPQCGKQFKTASKFNVHMRIHTGETPYKCRFCDKMTNTRNILIAHERTHTGEKPYTCTICGKSFAQSSILNTHKRLHTGRPEQCSICEKRFCRPAQLKLHMRKHTGEKPYVCDVCGHSFQQKSHLVEHRVTHNNERPFKCDHCDKTFKTTGALKCHFRLHTGSKKHKQTTLTENVLDSNGIPNYVNASNKLLQDKIAIESPVKAKTVVIESNQINQCELENLKLDLGSLITIAETGL